MEIASRVPSAVRKEYVAKTKQQYQNPNHTTTTATRKNLHRVQMARRIKKRKGQDMTEVDIKRNNLCKQLYENGCAQLQPVYDDFGELKELLGKHTLTLQPTSSTYTQIKIDRNVPNYLRKKLAGDLDMEGSFSAVYIKGYIHFSSDEVAVMRRYKLHTHYGGLLKTNINR